MRNPIGEILENACGYSGGSTSKLQSQLRLMLRFFSQHDQLGLICCELRVDLVGALSELGFLELVGPVYPNHPFWYISVKLTESGKAFVENFMQGMYDQ